MKTLDLANYGPVIPVIVIDKVEDAVPMAEALLEGGIKVLEVTLRTACAIEAMDRIIKHLPEAIVGAGTVRTKADASAAKSIGCQFAVSPGYTSEIGKHCLDIGLPLLPGVSTGSEVKDQYRLDELRVRNRFHSTLSSSTLSNTICRTV